MAFDFPNVPMTTKAWAARGTVAGVGINDADYQTSPILDGVQVTCPFYVVWHSMLKRCYAPSQLKWVDTYLGCSVAEEWHRFSNFRAWMVQQEWEGKELDKDILVPGNKTYGPSTCVFVDALTNALLFVPKKRRTNGLPRHVCPRKNGFIVEVSENGERGYYGHFPTVELAAACARGVWVEKCCGQANAKQTRG